MEVGIYLASTFCISALQVIIHPECGNTWPHGDILFLTNEYCSNIVNLLRISTGSSSTVSYLSTSGGVVLKCD